MNDTDFQKAYEEQNRADYITNATIATVIQIPLNLSCSVMDYVMYPDLWLRFLKARICSVLLVALAWVWFKFRPGNSSRKFGIVWIMSPLLMILWLTHKANDPYSPYYAGLNIILLGMGLLTPWAYLQNLLVSLFVLVMYVTISMGMKSPQPAPYLINNATFLFLTSAIVVSASITSARQRLREFTLRYQLDQNKRELETTNLKLADQNAALEQANRDIREAEAQLVQSEKMASLGLLAAKIAHEIRNPLNYARMNLDTLRKRFKNLPPEQHAEAGAIVADMSDGFTRIDSIVSDLLTFSQPGGQEPEPVDVAHIFKTTLRYEANQLEEKNIRLEQNLTLGHLIWVNRQQFNQVLVNLLENSIDALSAKEFSGDDQPTITVSCRLENDRQLISIRDNGAGIDPQNLAKIFDPFFTTKDIGKGTGLGLSICFGIVRGYSGNLRVESAPGKFCEFIIDLPANDPSKPAHGNA
jgi:two-component system sensor histidine kinase PhcS